MNHLSARTILALRCTTTVAALSLAFGMFARGPAKAKQNFSGEPKPALTRIAGQNRTAVAPKINPTPDALVYSDRTWVYYLAANSSVPRKLAKGNYPALSPDQKRVAYCLPQNSDVSAPAKATVMLFDLSTGKTTTVTEANAWIAHLRWSPNGERISLTLALSTGKRELDTVAADGTHKQKLITGGEQGIDDIFSPAWAPDGQSIYFQDMNNLVQVSTSGEVLTRNPLGPIAEEKEAVTSADSFVPSPTDANVFAYTRSVPGSALFEKTYGEPNTALFLYDMTTKTRKRLTSIDQLAMDPVWSRDGRFIYFAGYRDREGHASYPYKIYRIGRDGTGLIQIISGEMPDA